MSALKLVEDLVSAVARAFYDDTTVIVLDALIQEKFIRDEELGPRLKLPNKDVTRVIASLREEQLVQFEDLTMDDRRTSRCWYVDYRKFVFIAHYRMYLMQKELQEKEKLHFNSMFFECPTCHDRQTDLQVMRLLGKDGKSFICTHCCPGRSIRDVDPEPYFTLVEYNNKIELAELDVLSRKMSSQLSDQPKFHEGIFDILSKLKEISPEEIIHNRPSDNIKRGIMGSRITDEDIQREIEENNKKLRGKARKDGLPFQDKSGDISFEFSSGADANGESDKQAVDAEGEPAPKRQKSLPFFADGSTRVYGAKKSAEDAPATSVGRSSGILSSKISSAAVVTATSSFSEIQQEPVREEEMQKHVVLQPTVNSVATLNVDPVYSVGTMQQKLSREEELKEIADIEWED